MHKALTKEVNKMALTNVQKYEVTVLIDKWYLIWKDKMTSNGEPHSLGFAKEQLKQMLCE